MEIKKNEELISTGYGGGMYHNYDISFDNKKVTVEEALNELLKEDIEIYYVRVNDYHYIYQFENGIYSKESVKKYFDFYKDKKIIYGKGCGGWYCDGIKVDLYVKENYE